MNCCNNEIEKNLLNKYLEMDLGSCDICMNCRNTNKNLSLPVCCWFVGTNFEQQKKRILFVGKNARGYNELKSLEMVFNDGRKLWEKNWAYWSYTREIVKEIYGNESAENIAFTNIIKCNQSDDKDTTSDSTMDFCIKKKAVILEEIKIIKPTHIVFYTNTKYDNYIKNNIFENFNIILDNKKVCGTKQIHWLEAYGSIGEEKYSILRTDHPERKKKKDFIANIIEWINKN